MVVISSKKKIKAEWSQKVASGGFTGALGSGTASGRVVRERLL